MHKNPNIERFKHIQNDIKDKFLAYFGVYPQKCELYIQKPYAVLVFEECISPLEKSLLQQQEVELVDQIRSAMMNPVLLEIATHIHHEAGMNIESWYYDWNYSANQGVIIAREAHPIPSNKEPISFPFIQLVLDTYKAVHRMPKQIEMTKLSPDTFILSCSGVLFDIERRLFLNGHEKILRKREPAQKLSFIKTLREKLPHEYKNQFEELFILWDYKNDLALICFLFDPRF